MMDASLVVDASGSGCGFGSDKGKKKKEKEIGRGREGGHDRRRGDSSSVGWRWSLWREGWSLKSRGCRPNISLGKG